MAQTKEREIQLDVVRGIAILLAMGWHLNPRGSGILDDTILFPGSMFGWAGVDLFFVLSGFLVGGLILKEIQVTGAFQMRRFFIRRALRLWPVLYLFLIAQVLADRFPWDAFVPQVLFHVQNFFRTPLNHLWSLAVEEHFYLAAAFLALWAARSKTRPRTIATFLVALILLATVLRLFGLMLGVDDISLMWQTQYRADALALGVLLALLKLHYPARYAALRRRTWLLGLVVAAGCVVLTAITVDLPRYQVLIGLPCAEISAAALLLFMDGRPIVSWLRPLAKCFAFLGLYSYSIYIWHIGTGRILGHLLAAKLAHDTPEWYALFAYGSAITAAFVIAKLLEQPALALRDRLFPSGRSIPRDYAPDGLAAPLH